MPASKREIEEGMADVVAVFQELRIRPGEFLYVPEFRRAVARAREIEKLIVAVEAGD